MNQERSLLLIDGFNLLSRGYFATAYGKDEADLPKTEDGLYTNGLRVFWQKLFQLVTKHQITHLAIAWDVKREESIRRLEFPDYKATRGELPEPLIQQYQTCLTLIEELGIKELTTPPYEADDAIGAIAGIWEQEESGPCYIYSNDKDLLQLLSPQTSQIIASKKGEETYTLEHFRSEYGIEPSQWPDVKALLGDKSDNIPGCAGIGPKTGLPLIQHYGTIEGIYENIDALEPEFTRCLKKLHAGKEATHVSKQLATIICEIESLKGTQFTEYELRIDADTVATVLKPFSIRTSFQQPLF
ncbi:5'-3' exonuclease [Alkalicoccobacillus murimartini]|uniref:5'-3' exonuclease n=1 Tax=Alkalicoccobacillus murimartini TaxID=171685 RepID=A0ABT9YF47_9BACI|nr:5'-3' exonuclease [Alkalicoccobacillus murimartini]MDQ0206161.1 5'-3' exonuclease [Alkalicoccobacillus murimartini]